MGEAKLKDFRFVRLEFLLQDTDLKTKGSDKYFQNLLNLFQAGLVFKDLQMHSKRRYQMFCPYGHPRATSAFANVWGLCCHFSKIYMLFRSVRNREIF